MHRKRLLGQIVMEDAVSAPAKDWPKCRLCKLNQRVQQPVYQPLQGKKDKNFTFDGERRQVRFATFPQPTANSLHKAQAVADV